MAPRPHGAPDAAGRHDADGCQIAGESEPTPRVVRPEVYPDAQRYREQEPEENAERARGALLLEIVGARGGGRSFRWAAFRREQRLVGDRLQLAVDLRQLLRPVALGHR